MSKDRELKREIGIDRETDRGSGQPKEVLLLNIHRYSFLLTASVEMVIYEPRECSRYFPFFIYIYLSFTLSAASNRRRLKKNVARSSGLSLVMHKMIIDRRDIRDSEFSRADFSLERIIYLGIAHYLPPRVIVYIPYRQISMCFQVGHLKVFFFYLRFVCICVACV